MLKKELLDILVCPNCKGELEYLEGKSKLDCHSCNLSYRIDEDIPVMLVDEATPIE